MTLHDDLTHLVAEWVCDWGSDDECSETCCATGQVRALLAKHAHDGECRHEADRAGEQP